MIASLCPQARVIDLTHGVARHDVRAGALALRDALAYMPAGVMLAVVDPDVGAERRAVALSASDGRLFVGPDNGLLMPAVEQAGGSPRGGRHRPLAVPARAGLGHLPRPRHLRARRRAPRRR